MRKWVNFDKIIANRDFVMLDNDEIQGLVQVEDLPKIIEECDLHKLEIIVHDTERNIIKNIKRITYYDTGEITREVIFQNFNTDTAIDNIDPLNIFGRIIVNRAIMETMTDESNN